MNNELIRNDEIVLKGHPDRICDTIAEAFVKWIYEKDGSSGRVALELAYNGKELSAKGEIKSTLSDKELVNSFTKIANKIIIEQTDKLPLINWMVSQQSEEINKASQTGYGDNTIAYGYYNHETKTNKTPARVKLLELEKEIYKLHSKKRPDGKIILINGELSISIEKGINKDELIKLGFKNITIFEKSGGFADTGVVGRKLVAERHGNGIPHGGGAFTGKDFTKGDKTFILFADDLAKRSGERFEMSVLVQVSGVFGKSIVEVKHFDEKNELLSKGIVPFTLEEAEYHYIKSIGGK